MNILFIGPYRQNDEWGRKSRDMLYTLKQSGHSITSRPIFLSNNIDYAQFEELSEHVVNDTYDIVIQFVLQPFATYVGGAKNIGVFNYDTVPTDIPWCELSKEALMDEIWTENLNVKKSLESLFTRYNINTKVKHISPSINTLSLPPKDAVELENRNPELNNKFIFYYIGNPLDSKDGFQEAFIAYINTFTSKDDVVFMIFPELLVEQQELTKLFEKCKAYIGNLTSTQDQAMVKVEMPSQGRWSDIQRIKLHLYGDVLVSPSYNVCGHSSVLEAAIYGNMPIINDLNSVYSFLGEDNAWGIKSFEETCLYKDRPLPFRFTGGECWHKPSIKSIGQQMYECYINKFKRDQKIKCNSKLRERFERITYPLSSKE